MVLSRNFVKTGPDFRESGVMGYYLCNHFGSDGGRSSDLGTLSFYWERTARKDSGGRFTVLKSLVVSRYDLSKIHKHVLIIIYYMCSPSIPSHCMSVIMFFFHNTSSHCVCTKQSYRHPLILPPSFVPSFYLTYPRPIIYQRSTMI